MPIYEFYCRKCNTIYNFFSKSVNTSIIPSCPKCKNVTLERRMSIFTAITGSGKDNVADAPLNGLDESKIDKAMMKLATEAEKMKDDDRIEGDIKRKEKKEAI